MADEKTETGSRGHLIPPAPVPLLRHCVVYEIELDQIAKGSPGSTHLDFALALLPLSAGLLAALLTMDSPSVYHFMGFVAATTVFLVAGLFCLVQWLRHRGSAGRLLTGIKKRMQPADIHGAEEMLPP